ncbi:MULTISPECIES: polysaccharide lyase family 1 protein [Streptomyces]|uniref:pectate lyase family protein n=2 Tax=Streptomyces TaxID=1883 RepID=UPI000CD4BB87|nr:MULTISPECIES: right-handed parallel beta-helix repeat-containing protein [Streptomyces]
MTNKKKTLVRSGIAGAGAAALLAGSWAAGLGGATAGAAEPAAPAAEVTASADPHSDTPLGYAAQAGGTTGGHGASTVHEHLLSEYAADNGYSDPGVAMYDLLKAHAKAGSDEGLVIYVDTTVVPDNLTGKKMDVKDVSNVSILGVGDSGEFDGAGFKVTRSDNIIFRNLNIHHVHQGEGDAIEVTSNSHHVWIDHNEFSSELDGVDKDYYDGLVDVKHNSEYVTVSWNYFHDHWKGMLVGHNDSAGSAADKITYHHNHFQNMNSRIPLIRHADVHFVNNLVEDVSGSAINARMGAQVLVEGNYFDGVGSGETDTHADYPEGPVGWWYGSSQTGYWNLQDNTFVDSPHEHLTSTTDFTPPYSFDADSPADARSAVQQYAGTGVIDITP